MSHIDKELKEKSTNRMSLSGRVIHRDDDHSDSSDDYADIELKNHRLVDEQWLLGLVEEVRKSRASRPNSTDNMVDRMPVDSPVLRKLLSEVFLLGQGNKPTGEFLELLKQVDRNFSR